MNRNNEMILKLPTDYVQDDYLQLMITYREFLMLYGNNKLLFYKNYLQDDYLDNYTNDYLKDPRKEFFPYSNIAEHIEKIKFWKMHVINQILDFNKTYISVNDGMINKLIAFKDNNNSFVYSKLLNNKDVQSPKTKIVSTLEIKNYLISGMMKEIDDEQYDFISILNTNGFLYQKENIIDSLVYLLDNVSKKFMIKSKKDGTITIDTFAVYYIAPDKYEIMISPIPINEMDFSFSNTSAILKKFKNPKINLKLNPNITKDQLEEEKRKVLISKRK